MISPFDGSPLTKKQDNVLIDQTGGYLILDSAAIKQQCAAKGYEKNTREIKLENLGVFPLAKASLPLLDKKLPYNQMNLAILPLLKKSQIPIFASEDAKTIYIPAEATAICRYFHELWSGETETDEETDPVLSGFAVIASYAGL